MDDQIAVETPGAHDDPTPMQAHTCTAIVEELVAETADGAWDDLD